MQRRSRFVILSITFIAEVAMSVFGFESASLAQTPTPVMKRQVRRSERSFIIEPGMSTDTPSTVDCSQAPYGGSQMRMIGHSITTGTASATPRCRALNDAVTGMSGGGERRCLNDRVIQGFRLSGNQLEMVCNP